MFLLEVMQIGNGIVLKEVNMLYTKALSQTPTYFKLIDLFDAILNKSVKPSQLILVTYFDSDNELDQATARAILN